MCSLFQYFHIIISPFPVLILKLNELGIKLNENGEQNMYRLNWLKSWCSFCVCLTTPMSMAFVCDTQSGFVPTRDEAFFYREPKIFGNKFQTYVQNSQAYDFMHWLFNLYKGDECVKIICAKTPLTFRSFIMIQKMLKLNNIFYRFLLWIGLNNLWGNCPLRYASWPHDTERNNFALNKIIPQAQLELWFFFGTTAYTCSLVWVCSLLCKRNQK